MLLPHEQSLWHLVSACEIHNGAPPQTALILAVCLDADRLALAVKRGARFATLDENIDPTLIPGGHTAYHLIPL